MSRLRRVHLRWLLLSLGAWVALLELKVLAAPDLDAGPLLGD